MSRTRTAPQARRPQKQDIVPDKYVVNIGQASTPFGLCVIAWGPSGIASLHFVENVKVTHQAAAIKRAMQAVQHACPGATFQTDAITAQVLCDRIFTPAIGPALDITIAPRGTSFQMKVWQALRQIPFGTVVSYSELATQLGSPSAARAVGSAIAANGIGYLIPCHRVVRKSGEHGQFRWGAERKIQMLDWETNKLASMLAPR